MRRAAPEKNGKLEDDQGDFLALTRWESSFKNAHDKSASKKTSITPRQTLTHGDNT